MTEFADLHAHFLPAVDDGAKTPEEALAILRDSYAQGTRLIAATPHCTVHRSGDISRFLLRRAASLDKLQQICGDTDMPEIILGAEIYVDHDVSCDEGIEKLCFSGTTTMLLEPMFDTHYTQFAETVYSLNQRGITAVIAHIDRYPHYGEIMQELRGLRVVYQLNATRFLSFRGRRLLKKILAKDECFFVSSDTHNMAARRCFMKDAYAVARKIDPLRADEWFSGNAKALLFDTVLRETIGKPTVT